MLGRLNRRAFLYAIAALPAFGKLIPKAWKHAGAANFEQAERLVRATLAEGMRGIPSKRSISIVAHMPGIYTPPVTPPSATVTAIHARGGIRVLRCRANEDTAAPVCIGEIHVGDQLDSSDWLVGHCFELGPDRYACVSIEL
jgi:hypothetical protein